MLVTFDFQIIFLETICNDERIIERNIRLKIQQSPDYAEEYASLRNHLIVMPMGFMYINCSPSAGQILRLDARTSKIDFLIMKK